MSDFENQENIIFSMVELYVEAVYKEFVGDKSDAISLNKFKSFTLQGIATKLQRRAFELGK